MVTANFTTVNGNKTDTNDDGGFDAVGNGFQDANNFTKTDLGLGNFVTIATLQFRGAAPARLTLVPEFAQNFNFVTFDGSGFRGPFATINAREVVYSIPEPTSPAAFGLSFLGLVSRRRRL